MHNSASAALHGELERQRSKIISVLRRPSQAEANKWLVFFGWYKSCGHTVGPAKFYVGLGFKIKGQLEPPLGYCDGLALYYSIIPGLACPHRRDGQGLPRGMEQRA
jgi:hypothetical protein